MSELKHTPGPWFLLEGDEGSFNIEDHRGAVICSRNRWGSNQGASKANGRLMVAAPEMLEALEDVVGRFVEAFPTAKEYGPIKKAYGAIAKAKGE